MRCRALYICTSDYDIIQIFSFIIMIDYGRSGKPRPKKALADTKSHKSRDRKSTKCGCKMRVIFAPPEDEGDEDGGDGEEQESNSDDEKVFVVQEVSFEHTGGCKPGAAQQRVLTRVSTAGSH
jgi:hypothetical protein